VLAGPALEWLDRAVAPPLQRAGAALRCAAPTARALLAHLVDACLLLAGLLLGFARSLAARWPGLRARASALLRGAEAAEATADSREAADLFTPVATPIRRSARLQARQSNRFRVPSGESEDSDSDSAGVEHRDVRDRSSLRAFPRLTPLRAADAPSRWMRSSPFALHD